jgi:hypothetical protein
MKAQRDLKIINLTHVSPRLAEPGNAIVTGKPPMGFNPEILKPVQTRKKPPGRLDIYALLPQDNSKQCGEATCLAFAVGLVMNKHSLLECTPLQSEPAYLERKTTLEAML